MTPGLTTQMVFLSSPQQKLMATGLTIFTYHKIGLPPRGTTDPFLFTAVEEFERQFAALRNANYNPTSLDRIEEGAQNRSFIVTFDDGFRSTIEKGMEILNRHKIKAIQFIVSGSIGKENHWDIIKGDVAEPLMDTAQIKQWLAAGNEIGSHSVTHRNLKTLDKAELREEIIASRKFLEDSFGVEVRHFCYPFGGWTPAVRDAVIEAGYKTACSVEFGVNPPGSDRFALRRIIPLSRGGLLRKVFHRLLCTISPR